MKTTTATIILNNKETKTWHGESGDPAAKELALEVAEKAQDLANITRQRVELYDADGIMLESFK